MSSILKALKKLEAEKNIHKPEVVRIPPQTRSFPAVAPLRYGIAALLFLACGFAASRYYKFSSSDAKPAASVPRPAVPKTEPAAQLSLVKVPVVRIAEERIIPAPEQRPAGKDSPRTATILSRDATRKSMSAAGNTTVRQPHMEPKATVATPARPASPAVQPAHVLPDERKLSASRPLLKVEGIAFMDGVDSVAMINGVQASKSTVVEGAKVEAVMRDRVVFSYLGERFEILLGRSSKP